MLVFFREQETHCWWQQKGASREAAFLSFITFSGLRSTCREVLVAILKCSEEMSHFLPRFPTGLAHVLLEIIFFPTPLLRWYLGGGWEGGLLVLQAQELMEMVGVVPFSHAIS